MVDKSIEMKQKPIIQDLRDTHIYKEVMKKIETTEQKEPPFTNRKFKLLKNLPGVRKGAILVDWGLFVFKGNNGMYGSRASRMYRFDYKTIRRMKDWFLFIPETKNKQVLI